jgi:hypothetical protein
MEPCPHCGLEVHLATHKCYVTQRDLSCWTCGQKGHVRMTCKAGRPGSATVTMSPHAEPEDLNRTLMTLRRQLDGLSGRDEARFLVLKEDLHDPSCPSPSESLLTPAVLGPTSNVKKPSPSVSKAFDGRHGHLGRELPGPCETYASPGWPIFDLPSAPPSR